MTISRRQLYEAGEPLGDCATRAKIGCGVVCGFGGGSSSSSAQNTTTNNYDQRQAIDASVSNTDNSITDASSRNYSDSRSFADNSNTTSNTSTSIVSTDFGSVKAGADVSMAALVNNSTNTEHLFNLADTLFSKTQRSLDANVKLAGDLNSNASSAYSDATSQASGTKNMIMAGIAVVGIVGALAVFKK